MLVIKGPVLDCLTNVKLSFSNEVIVTFDGLVCAVLNKSGATIVE